MLLSVPEEEIYLFYIILWIELDPVVKTTGWVSVKPKSPPDAESLYH